jgi:hypothetical protein
MLIVSKEYCDPVERVLTVRKTSPPPPGDGFAAYDRCTGGLAFRADTYGRGHGGGAASPGELALLGPAGEPLLTVRRRRSSILGGAVVELLPSSPVPSAVAPPPVVLRVDGSFPRRCCRVVLVPSGNGEKEKVVAEIRRKVDVAARVVMGRDVFVLRVSPGFDAAFAMGIVLVLDQIAGDEAGVDAGDDADRRHNPCNSQG